MGTIQYMKGNIFNSKADILVCPVNTEGIMGAGLAKQFKKWWEPMYKSYTRACYREDLTIGHPWLWNSFSDRQHVLCFPTKEFWSERSDLQHIESGLKNLVRHWRSLSLSVGAKSIAFPKLGSGLGGLDWDDVKPIMEKHLRRLNATVEIWE